MNDILEKIVAAAIRDTDGKIHYISSPARHHHVIWWMGGKIDELMGGTRKMSSQQLDQGFLTSTGRYVDRREAGIIAIRSGQIKELQHPPSLFSEDLW